MGEAPEFVINSLSVLSLFTLFHFTVPIQICRIICREYKCQFVQIRENMSFSKKKEERHCVKKIQIYLSKLYFIVTLIMPLWKRGYIVLQLSVGRYVGRSVDQVLSAQYLLTPSPDQHQTWCRGCPQWGDDTYWFLGHKFKGQDLLTGHT